MMRIKYLETSKETIFNVIAHKTDNKIECHTILINPLCRFIDNEEDSQFLINAITDYSNKLELLNISENLNSDLILEQDYLIFGVTQAQDNNFQFIYSEEFQLPEDGLKYVHKNSIELANIIISALGANSDSVEKYLEEEINEMIEYNYVPLKEGVIEVFGIVLISGESNSIDLSVKYYSDPENRKDSNDELLLNLLNNVVPLISNEFKTYNFFMVTEPTTIIRLGVSTNGEYLIDTNHILLNQLDDDKLNTIKDLISQTYESL